MGALSVPKMHGVYLWCSGGHLLRSVPGVDGCSLCAQDARSVSLVQGGPPVTVHLWSKCVLSLRPRCTECIFRAGGAAFRHQSLTKCAGHGTLIFCQVHYVTYTNILPPSTARCIHVKCSESLWWTCTQDAPRGPSEPRPPPSPGDALAVPVRAPLP